MHWLTTTHARRWQLARDCNGQGAVYQGRFKAIPVKSDQHFLWVCRYVERNSLRATLVEKAEEWPWSSLWQRQRREAVPWLANWPVGCPADWAAVVNAPQTQAEVDALRQAMAKGAPFGDDSWRAHIEARLETAPRSGRGRRPVTRSVLNK